MKHFKLFLTVVMAMMLCTTTTQADVRKQTHVWQNTDMKIATPELRKYSSRWGLANQASAARAQRRATAEIGTPSGSIVTSGFGFLQGPDGLDWLFTENPTYGGQFGDEIKKSTFTIYDAAQNSVGTISHTVDADKSVNALYPYGVITTDFFDNNSSTYEILLYEHAVLGAGITAEKVYVYNTKGEKVAEYDGGQVAIYHIQQTSWDSYDRMLLMSNIQHEGEYVHRIDVCKRKGYSETNEIEHTFFVSEEKVIGHVGPFFNTYEIDNKPYYVISQYEKPFFTGEWDMNTGQQFETPNNSFIVTVYNEDYEVVEEIRIPCEKPEHVCAMYGFGYLTYDDFSKGLYSNNDEYNFVVTVDKYDMMKDKDKFTFDVYDGNSHKIKTIDSDVDAEGIMQLADLKGHETQFAFGHTETNEDNETSSFIRLVNIPSCQVAATITPTVDLPVSFEMNRCIKGNDYQYVTSFSDAETDADNNMYAVVGWFNSDLSFDRKVLFNLGTNGLMAKFNFTSTALNPFLCDADSDLEYFYLSNVDRADGSNKKDTYLNIADHEGNTIASYVGDATKGDILTVGFLNPKTESGALYIGYRDDRYKYTLEFVDLPLEEIKLQGAGTAEDPYLISTWSDLQQIKNHPTAHFKQINDIDMSITGETWQAVPQFSGTYDGGNFKLRNMYISNPTADHLAFFGEVSEGTIRNMVFTAPKIEVGANNPYVGIAASYAVASTIENIHVYNAEIVTADESAAPIVGGIVATTSFEGKVTACSFNDGIINVPGAQIGGIAGNAGTGVIFTTCAFIGEIVGNEYVGGILGQQGQNVKVQNCHVDAAIKGISSLGGLVGWNADRATITNNIVEGTLEVLEESRWGARTGGLVGTLAEDWEGGSTKFIQYNVVLLDAITLPTATDATVHGIVGFSSENAVLEEGESFHPENGLAYNYVTLATYADKMDNVGGQLVSADTLTQAFFEENNFVYGDSIEGPWGGATLPRLFVQEYVVSIPATGIRINKQAVQLFSGDTYELTAFFTPNDATTRDVTWATADATIATVANGVVTGVAAGTTTITATTADGLYTASCEVTVVTTIEITGLTLDTANVTIDAGDVYQLVATLLPDNATYQAVVWTSADENVARVEDGWVIAVAEGETVITVATQDGGFTATCSVTVRDDTAVDNVEANGAVSVRKVLYKDTIYIIRNNNWYTIDGLRVK